ncbi:MAG: hypothetical protein Q4G50_07430 [Corynebacterium sp.]|uniref:hypothetical protein n=1 Tax=Corynebacterium sp. TaxID=1720 RepID=UPI0026DEFA62|nr:hypothetical protein [Corynebacterium sp.]MDO5669819.1 hypothetical protein [Corynebacterium sp.]
MSHYNLYDSLGLDRTEDPATLRSRIDELLASDNPTNLGGREELYIAQRVLGDEQRRAIYDSRLDDPNAPEVTVDALRELSHIEFGAPTPQPQQAAATEHFEAPAPGDSPLPQQEQPYDNRFENQVPSDGPVAEPGPAGERKSFSFPQVSGMSSKAQGLPKPAIAGAAVAGIIILGLVLWGLFSLVGGGGGKVKSVANEFLDLRTVAETEEWLGEYADPRERDQINRQLDLRGDFAGVDNFMRVNDPQVGDVVDMTGLVRSAVYSDTREITELFESAGIKGMEMVIVEDRNGNDTGYRLTFGIDEQGPQLLGIDRAVRVDESEFRDYIEN